MKKLLLIIGLLVLVGCGPQKNDNPVQPPQNIEGVTVTCYYDTTVNCPTPEQVDTALKAAASCMGVAYQDYADFVVMGSDEKAGLPYADIWYVPYPHPPAGPTTIRIPAISDAQKRVQAIQHQILHYLHQKSAHSLDLQHTHPCLSQYPIQQ